APAAPAGPATRMVGTVQGPGAAATAPAQMLPLSVSGLGGRSRPPEELTIALRRCEKAIQQDPKSAWPYFERAEVHRMAGDAASALADSDQALQREPALHQALGTRAWARSQKGDHEGALADCEQALRYNQRYAWAYATRAEIQRARGNLDQAIADGSEAIR